MHLLLVSQTVSQSVSLIDRESQGFPSYHHSQTRSVIQDDLPLEPVETCLDCQHNIASQ